MFGLAPAFRERLFKGRYRFVREFFRLEDFGELAQNDFFFRSLHIGVVFDRVGNAQVKVGKQNALVEFSLEHIDIERKRSRNLKQDFFGILPCLTSVHGTFANFD